MDHLLSPARSTTRTDAAPRLCGTVEGVEFWIRSAGDRPLRCVITESTLQAHFGAEENRPDTWLAAFALHRAAIETRARTACGQRDDVHVVLVTDSQGRLKAAVGRCAP